MCRASKAGVGVQGRVLLRSRRSQYAAEESERKLANWIHLQKQCYNGTASGALNNERIKALLELPGFEWPSRKDIAWSTMFCSLKKFFKLEGHPPTPKDHVLHSGKWLDVGKWYECQQNRGSGTPRQNSDLQAWSAALPHPSGDEESCRS